MIGAVCETAVRDFSEKFWLSNLAATTDDRIGKVLPHYRQEASSDPVTLSVESNGPPELDHGISATREPIDVSHVVKFDCDQRFARELKALRSVPLEG
jgi:hypothetical protein